MALILADRVQETCSSPGTGTVTLLGAVSGFQTFLAGIGNGNTTFYAIADQIGANWEVGIGTYSATGNTLARNTVLASSNSGSLANFSSGTQNVWCDYPAGNAVYKDTSGNIVTIGEIDANTFVSTNGIFQNANTITANQTISATNNGGSFGPITVATGVTVTVSSGSVWTVV